MANIYFNANVFKIKAAFSLVDTIYDIMSFFLFNNNHFGFDNRYFPRLK